MIPNQTKDESEHHVVPRRRHAVIDIDPYKLTDKKEDGFTTTTIDTTTEDKETTKPLDVSSEEKEEGGSVLVVDDDKVARQVLTKLLQQLGFEGKWVSLAIIN